MRTAYLFQMEEPSLFTVLLVLRDLLCYPGKNFCAFIFVRWSSRIVLASFFNINAFHISVFSCVPRHSEVSLFWFSGGLQSSFPTVHILLVTPRYVESFLPGVRPVEETKPAAECSRVQLSVERCLLVAASQRR